MSGPDPIIIHLTGTNIATVDGYEFQGGKGSVLGKTCRELAFKGEDLDRMVEVYRGKTICFKPMKLRHWCLHQVSEPDSTTIRETKWEPHKLSGTEEQFELYSQLVEDK